LAGREFWDALFVELWHIAFYEGWNGERWAKEGQWILLQEAKESGNNRD